MNLDQLQISEHASIGKVLHSINENKQGLIFFVNKVGIVVGVSTDGDIRRVLLKGKTLDDSINPYINKNFIWCKKGAPREFILKKLDGNVRGIPLLDEDMKLAGYVSKDHFPSYSETSIYARSRVPVRMSFGGGGSDITKFFSENKSAVINATISLYSHATLRKRSDSKISIYSMDLKDSFHAESLEHSLTHDGKFGLVLAVLKIIKPTFGFDLYLESDFPIGSGLGGSASISVAIFGCFNQFRVDQWNLHEIAEFAYQAERLYCSISGGWQDQYAAVFGGFNFIEFNLNQNIIHPLRLNSDILLELEEGLILCNTNLMHDSNKIHQDQSMQMKNSSVLNKINENVGISYAMRNELLRGNLSEFGKLMHDMWILKRQFSSINSSKYLDDIYTGALQNGALGGKLLGAGGGGYFLFYTMPFRKQELLQYLKSFGLAITPFNFDKKGMQSWRIREE